jgi:hypothetical protein
VRLGRLLQIEAGDISDDTQCHWRDRTNPRDCLQIGGWRVQNTTQIAEARQQGLGGLFDIRPGDSQSQQ